MMSQPRRRSSVTSAPATSSIPSGSFEPRVPQLRALIAVAREGSYTRAAEQLSYTESAVYLQVQALEKALGVALVKRARGRVSLTDAGEVVRRYALRIVQDIEGLAREVAGYRGSPPIVIGGGRSTAVYYLTPLIAEFMRLHPEVDIRLHIRPAVELVTAVEEGSMDLAASGGVRPLLADSSHRDSGLRFVPWLRGTWVLASPAGSPATAFRTLYIPEYMEFMTDAIGPVVRREIGFSPTLVVLETGEAVKSAVVAGLGLAVLPGAALRLERQEKLVDVRRLILTSDAVLLYHRPPNRLSPLVREFLCFLCRSRHRVNQANSLHLSESII